MSACVRKEEEVRKPERMSEDVQQCGNEVVDECGQESYRSKTEGVEGEVATCTRVGFGSGIPVVPIILGGPP